MNKQTDKQTKEEQTKNKQAATPPPSGDMENAYTAAHGAFLTDEDLLTQQRVVDKPSTQRRSNPATTSTHKA